MHFLFHNDTLLHRRLFTSGPGPDSLGEVKDNFCPAIFGVVDGRIVNDAQNPDNNAIFRFSVQGALRPHLIYYAGGDCYYTAGDMSLTSKEKIKIDKALNKAIDSGNYFISPDVGESEI